MGWMKYELSGDTLHTLLVAGEGFGGGIRIGYSRALHRWRWVDTAGQQGAGMQCNILHQANLLPSTNVVNNLFP